MKENSVRAVTTTLNAIRKHDPCSDGWEKLLKSLGKTKADAAPLTFSAILASNGIDDAIWCLRALPKTHHARIMLLACDYAERVVYLYEKQYPDDHRPRNAINVSRQYAKGEATEAAAGSAEAAAWGAAWDARDVDGFPAWAAGDAARAAAWTAAGAAGEAAGDAAFAAAWAAAGEAGDAARSAVFAARGSAREVLAAAAAARAAAESTARAAGEAEKKIQAELLVNYFG